jgi:hypothetical protein
MRAACRSYLHVARGVLLASARALEGRHVIIEPNSPSRGVLVAFIEVSGAPVELMQIDHEARPDL